MEIPQVEKEKHVSETNFFIWEETDILTLHPWNALISVTLFHSFLTFLQ